MFGDLLNIGVKIVTQPIKDTIMVVDGLIDRELEEDAVIRLGLDIAGGVVLGEVIENITEE